MHRVVKPFAFSLDGFTLIDLAIGDERDDFGAHSDGLLVDGYIAMVDGAVEIEPATLVEVPVAVDYAADEPPAPETISARRGRRRK